MVEATSALLLELIELIELPESELMQYITESLYFTQTFICIFYLIDSRQLVSRHMLHERHIWCLFTSGPPSQRILHSRHPTRSS